MEQENNYVEYTLEVKVTIWPKSGELQLNGHEYEGGVAHLTFFEASNAFKEIKSLMEELKKYD